VSRACRTSQSDRIAESRVLTACTHVALVRALLLPLRSWISSSQRQMRASTGSATAVLVGADGIIGGFAAAASACAACDARVHITGEAWRISAAAFCYIRALAAAAAQNDLPADSAVGQCGTTGMDAE
jgi:hypothetical protein